MVRNQCYEVIGQTDTESSYQESSECCSADIIRSSKVFPGEEGFELGLDEWGGF